MFEEAVQGSLVLDYEPYDAILNDPPLESWLYLASAEHRLLEFDSAMHHVQSLSFKMQLSTTRTGSFRRNCRKKLNLHVGKWGKLLVGLLSPCH